MNNRYTLDVVHRYAYLLLLLTGVGLFIISLWATLGYCTDAGCRKTTVAISTILPVLWGGQFVILVKYYGHSQHAVAVLELVTAVIFALSMLVSVTVSVVPLERVIVHVGASTLAIQMILRGWTWFYKWRR